MFKVNNKKPRTYKVWTYFTSCSCVFIVNFEYVIAGWVCNKARIDFQYITASFYKNMNLFRCTLITLTNLRLLKSFVASFLQLWFSFLHSFYGVLLFLVLIWCALSWDKRSTIFQYALYISFVCIYVYLQCKICIRFSLMCVSNDYCCFCNFCSSSAGKIVIIEVVLVTVEVLVLGGATSSITSDSKKIQKR